MKKLLYFLIVALAWSCNKAVEKQMPPMDKELFNDVMDREVAAKKGGNGHGNPHDNPPPVDTTTKKVYILYDFDGQMVNSPYWNSGVPFYCEQSGYSLSQQETAMNISRSDYSFNSNIVIGNSETEYYKYPANKRQRIIFTPSWQWYGQAGGVSYINGMAWGVDVPSFVFSSLVFTPENSGKAGSHEAGHGFGLRHDKDWIIEGCILRGEYEPGKVMGYCYGFSVWGHYNVCRDAEEQLAINNSVNL